MIDAGVNLSSSQFRHDLDAVVTRAREAGVQSMMVIGCDEADSQQALELAQQFDLYSCAGIHPHNAKDATDDFAANLTAMAQAKEVIAIGECGLDYNRDFSPRPQQREVFARQLALANELDMPVYLHERDAHDDMLAMLREYQPRGVLHCFTGNRQQAQNYLDLGLYLGITGWVCDERRGSDLNDALNVLPMNRLLIETDAPYLLPRTIRPKPKSRRCEPAHLSCVVAHLSQHYQVSPAQLSATSVANFHSLFALER
ncbi:TatD family hydrolase [Pseudoalteromonas sp. BDTF-M6]|uniref:TatD family hydrolase n=1 Tax=Pseudoalteromonas sp. BDTF-M6 TaxID=2796132 RepID=UPI001BAF92DF|nr:TatD family hydrolase [Pseudoalteromonas sp. BDTF-M6]MBS3799219.1 YchF/TatD family DNA exonuclease [Pseudoalteromonas sp. BDTF-M6]